MWNNLKGQINKKELEALKLDIVKRLDVSKKLEDEEVYKIIDETILEYVKEKYISMEERIILRKNIFNALRRLDVLQDLVEDESITEIMVNGPDKIFVEKDGKLYKSNVCFESEERLLDIIRRIATDVGRVINESKPIVDARLQDGSRINAVLPPVSLSGPVLTIRKFSKEIYSLDDLVAMGSLTMEAANFLKTLVGAGYNIFCSGGTGSGKTTLLNALIGCINESERIIVAEDTCELRINNPNHISLEVKAANGARLDEISIRTLIKTALRMRPDRLIVGEVRGNEAIDMLQALNTGHSGMSTGHSNSARDMLSRIETMVILEDVIPLQAVRSQIASAIDIIISMQRFAEGSRKITSIVELDGICDGEINLNVLYEFNRDKLKSGEMVGLVRKNNMKHLDKLEAKGYMYQYE